jgi:hypothetical protein
MVRVMGFRYSLERARYVVEAQIRGQCLTLLEA